MSIRENKTSNFHFCYRQHTARRNRPLESTNNSLDGVVDVISQPGAPDSTRPKPAYQGTTVSVGPYDAYDGFDVDCQSDGRVSIGQAPSQQGRVGSGRTNQHYDPTENGPRDVQPYGTRMNEYASAECIVRSSGLYGHTSPVTVGVEESCGQDVSAVYKTQDLDGKNRWIGCTCTRMIF